MAPVSTRISSIPRPARAFGFNAAIERLAWMVGSLLVFGIFWQVLADLLQNRYLPTPIAVFEIMVREAANGELWKHTSATLWRVAVAFVVSMFIGTAIGMALGRYKTADSFFDAWLILFPQSAGAGHDYALLHLVRTDRCRCDHGRCAEQNSKRRRQHARRYAQPLEGSLRDGDDVQVRSVENAPPRDDPAAGSVLRGRGAIRACRSSGRSCSSSRPSAVRTASAIASAIAFQEFDVGTILAYALAFILIVQLIEFAVLQPLQARVNAWRR